MTEATETPQEQEVTVTFMVRMNAPESEVRNAISESLTDPPTGWEITKISLGDKHYESLEAFNAEGS